MAVSILSSKAYDSTFELPDGAVSRSLTLASGRVSPYHREIMIALLGDYSSIERGIFERYCYSYNDYSYAGMRLLTLLSTKGVAAFALTLKSEIERFDADLVAEISEEQLFPELFDNPELSADQKEYLLTLLDGEYDDSLLRYSRLILQSVQAEEICCSGESSTDLLELLRAAVTDEASLSEEELSTVRIRYGGELIMMRYFVGSQ